MNTKPRTVVPTRRNRDEWGSLACDSASNQNQRWASPLHSQVNTHCTPISTLAAVIAPVALLGREHDHGGFGHERMLTWYGCPGYSWVRKRNSPGPLKTIWLP